MPRKRKRVCNLDKYNFSRKKIPKDPSFDSQSDSPSCSAKKICISSYRYSGFRIVDFAFILNSLKDFVNHGANKFGCSLNNVEILEESRSGLRSKFFLKCNMCGFSDYVSTINNSSHYLDINKAAVAGCTLIGIGHSNLSELLLILNIPCLSNKIYQQAHDYICSGWEKAAEASVTEAAALESKLAIESGNIDQQDGIPLITTLGDGAWSKRSYKSNYSASSGVATIVGYKTRKILHYGVKNKCCSICDRGNSKPHKCFKNWTDASFAMESSIIVEGFQQSVSKFNLKYDKFIGDGCSSCFNKITEARPYDNLTVEKIECRNHIFRNYCSKIREICKLPVYGPAIYRRKLSYHILRLRTSVQDAIVYRNSENHPFEIKVENLRRDILNSVYHVFGDHSNCADNFCKKDTVVRPGSISVAELQSCKLFDKLLHFVRVLATKSRSLIYNVDTNAAEIVNALIAKHVGGKRVNFSLRNSYQGRCAAAVVSHNTKKPYTYLHQILTRRDPPQAIMIFEEKHKNHLEQRSKRQAQKASAEIKPIKTAQITGNIVKNQDLDPQTKV